MSLSNTFEHDRCVYTISAHDDPDFLTLSCSLHGGILWERPYQVLSRAHELGLMVRHRWVVRGEQLFLETEGEHWRGASLHDQRLHRVDRRGLERVDPTD